MPRARPFLRSVLLLYVLVVCAPLFGAGGRTFVHPGVLCSKAELDFVAQRIKEGAEPWASEIARLRRSPKLEAPPLTLRRLDSRGPDAGVAQDNAHATYSLALLWYYTGDATAGRRALAHLNAWSDFEAFTAGTDQDKLQAGWLGAVLAPASEIMRLHPEWKPAEIAALQSMFRRVFYPQLAIASTWNGNVDLTQIEAWLGLAVFNDDTEAFDAALLRFQRRLPAYIYLRSDGALPPPIAGDGGDLTRFWFEPTRWVDGLTQETCRDNGHHAQFGLGSALRGAETAWHQGVDLYTPNAARFTAALELLATQLLQGSMQGLARNESATTSLFCTWEIGLSHFEERAGARLPTTRRLVLEQVRPRAQRESCNLSQETLTHAR